LSPSRFPLSIGFEGPKGKINHYDLGGEGEALGEFSEQKDGGVGGSAVVEEVEAGGHLGDFSFDGQREVAGLAGATDDVFRIEVVEGGLARSAGNRS